MPKPLMQLDQPSLQVEINSYRVGWQMIWATMFPLKYTQKFDLKGLTGNEGIPVAADKVAFNAKAPQKGRKKVGTWSGELHKISVARIKDEKDINEYEDALVLAQKNEDAAAARDLVNSVYDDVKFVHDALDARMEIDACEIASSGVYTETSVQDGDQVTADVINFNIPEGQKVGVSKVWTSRDSQTGEITVNENADGLGDIIKAQKIVKDAGKRKPMFCYITEDAFVNLQAQKATASRLYPQVKTLSLVTSEMVSLQNVNAYMQRNGYPTLLVIDPLINEELPSGEIETKKPWNENVITLALTPQLGYSYYKTVPKVKDTESLQSYGAYYKVTVSGQTDPMEEKTVGEAYVQQGLINRGSMVLVNVNNTQWANGARPA